MTSTGTGSEKKTAGRPRKANNPLSVTVALRLTRSQAELLKKTITKTNGKDTRFYIFQHVVRDAETLQEPALLSQVKEELAQQYAPNNKFKCPKCRRRAGTVVHVENVKMHFQCGSCHHTWQGEMKAP